MNGSHIITRGNIRVQLLSDTLIRIEQKGPNGFEDRPTFHVIERHWPGASANQFRVTIPDGESLKGVRIESKDGRILYECDGRAPEVAYLPAPGEVPAFWLMPDSPRIVPPSWGATPAPDDKEPASGWEVSNSAPDFYLFLPGAGGYARLRADFLKLTGPIPMPPLYAFGFWDSRWFPYTEASAIETIETYRRKRVPLDVFVVDTDWRVGASHGYEISKKHFPDMARFVAEAHKRNVRLMYNDHPEPVAPTALDPKELQFRFDGLKSLLDVGADIWWYDRNWWKHLHEPAPGLRKEVWGMRLFHDITQRCRPKERPLIMSNVHGVDNGWRAHPSDPAAHRFPIWWTGDTVAEWATLPQGIANGVDLGTISLLPYVNEDLAGHDGRGMLMMPTPELYVRFLQFGCFSPITRVHCTAHQTRYPWVYGKEAEKIVTNYIRLRYRLLPTLYSAARRAYEDGTPLLRRCDLEWPSLKAARDNQQFLFGDHLLIAPVAETNTNVSAIPETMLQTRDAFPGLRGAYFPNQKLAGAPVVERVDRRIAMAWANWARPEPAPVGNFSVRWEGTLGPIPASGTYEIGLSHTDGARLWVDGKLLIQSWKKQPLSLRAKKVRLVAGRRYAVRIEHFAATEQAGIALVWRQQTSARSTVERKLWIPPGAWRDVWTGETLIGPRDHTLQSPLHHLPMFAREGGLILSVPQMQHTGERAWDTVIVDAFIGKTDSSSSTLLYEDDGHSTAYQSGAFRKTEVALTRNGPEATLQIMAAAGHFEGAIARREWVVRLHLPRGSQATYSKARLLAPGRKPVAIPFAGPGARPGPQSGPVIEFKLAARDVFESAQVSIRI